MPDQQPIQLADLWSSSLEYGNRQASLAGDRDLGVPNWLETTGRQRGVILLRYDGMQEKTFNSVHYPTATKVKLAELRLEQRAKNVAARRQHRYDN